MELRNRWVRFKVRDAYLPPPEALLVELYGDDLLQGQVVDLSDSGEREDAFAVVEVAGLKQPVIVPVERLPLDCLDSTSDDRRLK